MIPNPIRFSRTIYRKSLRIGTFQKCEENGKNLHIFGGINWHITECCEFLFMTQNYFKFSFHLGSSKHGNARRANVDSNCVTDNHLCKKNLISPFLFLDISSFKIQILTVLFAFYDQYNYFDNIRAIPASIPLQMVYSANIDVLSLISL